MEPSQNVMRMRQPSSSGVLVMGGGRVKRGASTGIVFGEEIGRCKLLDHHVRLHNGTL